MNEKIISAIIRNDKTKPFFLVKPLYCTCTHNTTPSAARPNTYYISHFYQREHPGETTWAIPYYKSDYITQKLNPPKKLIFFYFFPGYNFQLFFKKSRQITTSQRLSYLFLLKKSLKLPDVQLNQKPFFCIIMRIFYKDLIFSNILLYTYSNYFLAGIVPLRLLLVY